MDTERLILDNTHPLLIDIQEQRNMCTVEWNYIATYIINIFATDNGNEYEILDSSYMTMKGGMNDDCYFSECTSNATVTDIILEDRNYPAGVYRFVLGVQAKGESYNTADGVEHDAWEEYELLSLYQFTEKEASICFIQPADINLNSPR